MEEETLFCSECGQERGLTKLLTMIIGLLLRSKYDYSDYQHSIPLPKDYRELAIEKYNWEDPEIQKELERLEIEKTMREAKERQEEQERKARESDQSNKLMWTSSDKGGATSDQKWFLFSLMMIVFFILVLPGLT